MRIEDDDNVMRTIGSVQYLINDGTHILSNRSVTSPRPDPKTIDKSRTQISPKMRSQPSIPCKFQIHFTYVDDMTVKSNANLGPGSYNTHSTFEKKNKLTLMTPVNKPMNFNRSKEDQILSNFYNEKELAPPKILPAVLTQ